MDSNSAASHVNPDEDGRAEPPLQAYEEDSSSWDDGSRGYGQDGDNGNEAALTAQAEEMARKEAEEAREAQEQRLERDALFARLNDRQREAVFMPNESALVLAAAGSGKTSVLTARIAHLVTRRASPVNARAILAVTFTNKTAIEMRTRLKKLLDKRTVNSLWVGTFHSLCNRMLRDNAQAAGLPKSFAILDVDGQEAMCRSILKDFGLTRSAVKDAKRKKVASAQASLLPEVFHSDDPEASAPTPTPEERLAAAGVLSVAEAGVVDGGDAGEFVTPAQCARYINSRKEAGQPPRPPVHAVTTQSMDVEQMEAVYSEYQIRCNRCGLLDFQDLLTRTVKLLEENREVREAMRTRFQAILVDEFQDTNDIQYRWLSLLKGPTAHVMAVGDDDQSIYAFRGAKPENMALFLQDLAARTEDGKTVPGQMIRLEHNYRSLPHILEVANAIIDRNTNRLGKILRTDKPDRGELVDLAFYGGGNFEASSIGQTIHDMVRVQGVQPSEIAILYRTNQQSRLLEAELNKRALPLTVYGGFRFYERQEVKFVLSYLDLVCDPDHDISLTKVANFPPRGLGERTLEELRQDAQIKGVTMLQMITDRAVQREENPSSVGGAAAMKKQFIMEGFADLVLDLIDAAQVLPLHKLIELTIEKSGLGAHYTAEAAESGAEEGNERLANMGELVSAACQFVIDNPEMAEKDTLDQLTEYLAHVALMTSTSESDMNVKNTISLMTVHSAKGLEFDHVFVTGLEEKCFPHARAIDEDAVWVPDVTQTQHALGAQGAGASAEIGDGPSIQEERRLMYVAITRARKTLQLSHCAQRLVNGEIRTMEPSRFINELPAHRVRFIDARRDRFGSTPSRTPAFGLPAIGLSSVGLPASPPASVARTGAAPVHVAQSASQKIGTAGAQPQPQPQAGSQKASPFSRFVRTPAATSGPVARPAVVVCAAREIREPSKPVPALVKTTGRRVGIIGTAGRDKAKAALMNKALWEALLTDVRARTVRDDEAFSGGAAWVDHTSVRLFLDGDVASLQLHLPAPLGADGRFSGPDLAHGGSAASAANYYHDMFKRATAVDGLAEIAEAITRGAKVTFEPEAPGYGAMKARNKRVADHISDLLAYTWGEGDVPVDGGTKLTWDMASARGVQRLHVGLASLGQTEPEGQTLPTLDRPRQRA